MYVIMRENLFVNQPGSHSSYTANLLTAKHRPE